MEFGKDGYVFQYNSLQGIINIEDEQGEFIDCLEFGPGYQLPYQDFEEICIAWLSKKQKHDRKELL